MNTEKFINENFPQDKARQFADILKDSINSYIDKKNSCTVEEWLNTYLSECLPDKSAEEIYSVANEMIHTIKFHDETIISMRNAINSGKSVATWFQEETASQHSLGQQAYRLAETHSALTVTSNQYTESDEHQEVIDVELINPDEWKDRNWNKYKMKNLVTETVRQAGDTALRATASDLFEKVTEYGFQTVITDTELIKESLVNGASTGLKVAAAGAMEIANERGILPEFESDTEIRSLIACRSVENLKTFGKIANNKIRFAEGLKEIADSSVAVLATIVKRKAAAVGTKVGQKIGKTVGTVFGPVGAAVGHFAGGVIGKMAGTTIGSKIVETAKKVCSAAKSVVSKVVSTVKSVGSKIKNGLKGLFNW